MKVLGIYRRVQGCGWAGWPNERPQDRGDKVEMTELTAEQFAQRAFDLNLVDERQLNAVWSQCGSRDIHPDEFRNILVRREILTNYQVDRLLSGERTGFFYGDYKVLYFVGAGSFARVYRSVHRTTGRIVALKVLRKRFAEEPLEAQKFIREGEMGKILRHPNIVSILEVHSERRQFFIVMEFVEGQSLREFVRLRGKVDPIEASQIMSGVMSGLVHAAEKGITHRDLKLSNVLISSDGRPQIVDFGLASMSDVARGNNDVTNKRTVDYAALEKATGVSKDDPRSDIYFAGCMYYHLLTGHPPLTESRDRLQRMNISRFREVVPIRSREPLLPSVVEAIVEKAMQLDASQRYAKPVDMMVDMQKAIKAMKAAADHGDSSASSSSLIKKEQTAILVVEGNPQVQEALRTLFKKHGLRVLLFGSVQHAAQKLTDDPRGLSCGIVSTASLGKEGLRLYQQLRSSPATAHLPTILLLGKTQQAIVPSLKLDETRHVALTMPLKSSELVLTIQRLLHPGKIAEKASERA